MCIDIVQIWFGIAKGQISSVICSQHNIGRVLSFCIFITTCVTFFYFSMHELSLFAFFIAVDKKGV